MSAEWLQVGGGVTVRLSTSGGDDERRHSGLCIELILRIGRAAREIAAEPLYAELQPYDTETGDPIEPKESHEDHSHP